MYQVLSVNWSAFLKDILPALQIHNWNNGTNGECQLGSGDLGLLPKTLWPTGVSLAIVWVSLAIVWVSWLLMGCPKWEFLVPPNLRCSIPSWPATHPVLLLISISNTDLRKGQQKYHEIQPSEIDEVSYNKSQ